MVDLLTDVNAAEQFLKEIGMIVVKNRTPMYETIPCDVAGAITHPVLDDFLTSTAIFVYFLPNIGYQIFKLNGLKLNGTVMIDRIRGAFYLYRSWKTGMERKNEKAD